VVAEITAPIPPRRPAQLKLANGDGGVGQPFRHHGAAGSQRLLQLPLCRIIGRSLKSFLVARKHKNSNDQLVKRWPMPRQRQVRLVDRSLAALIRPLAAMIATRLSTIFPLEPFICRMARAWRRILVLGNRLDDPRYVHERMHGATPPHTYNLTMREALFHGVEAIRLNPVGNGNIFGRAGLLAHTYMLGPNGDLNGAFHFVTMRLFSAHLKAEKVKRLVVVAMD